MTKSLFFLFVIAFCSSVKPLLADQAALVPAGKEFSKRDIRSQVAVLRQDKFQKMPYLDKGYIRSVISPERVEERMGFLSGDRKSLSDLIERAIRVNTPARSARESISLAKRRMLAALRKMFPSLDFELRRRSGSLSGSRFNSFSYKFTSKQPIFRGGILWNAVLREKADLEASKKEYEKTISDLVYDVSNAYFEYNRSEQIYNDNESSVEKMQRFSEISQQKFDEEIISEIEHLNVKSLYGQMNYDFETSKQELELARLEIQKFLDLTPEDDIEVEGFYDINVLVKTKAQEETKGEKGNPGLDEKQPFLFEGDVRVPELPQLVDMSYQHRPELQVESAKLQSARLEERIRWGEMIPHADVTIEFGKLGEAFDINELDPGLRPEFRLFFELNWNMAGSNVGYSFENNETGPSVTQFLQGTGSKTATDTIHASLFDGLDDLVQAKEAEVDKLNQIVELEKAEKEVIQDVKRAYFDFQKALINVKSTLQRVDYRERLVLLAEHRLGQNEIEISEYMQAEIDLLREKTELHNALRDYFIAKAALNRAVGIKDFLPINLKGSNG